MADPAVSSTNDDASTAKRSATLKGYWSDNHIQYFVKSSQERKPPEINRGYYIRYKCVRELIEKFIAKTNQNCQIVSIGAGFDTLYWNLNEKDNLPKHGLYEIDLQSVVEKKCFFVSTRPPLCTCLKGNVKINKNEIDSELYHLISCDITDVKTLDEKLCSAGIKKDIPTLFIAECVFVYIPFENVRKVLEYMAKEFRTVMLVDYDPINLNDKFGEVMKEHLRGRQCSLYGVQTDLASKKNFYNMFATVNGELMMDLYNALPGVERTRMERLEFLDEVDLLYDLLKHYALTWSFNDGDNVGLEEINIFE